MCLDKDWGCLAMFYNSTLISAILHCERYHIQHIFFVASYAGDEAFHQAIQGPLSQDVPSSLHGQLAEGELWKGILCQATPQWNGGI